jgi:hypothetical protein
MRKSTQNMKLHFLYKVTNLLTGRYFVGSKISEDATWLSSPTKLCDLAHREVFQFNTPLLADLRQLGLHNFVIESLHASPDANEIAKMIDRMVPHHMMASGAVYNQLHSSVNPVVNEAKRQAMQGNQRAKKVPRFGNNSKYVRKEQDISTNGDLNQTVNGGENDEIQ